MSHTPGPWHVVEFGRVEMRQVRSAGGELIAYIAEYTRIIGEEEDNAHLIAAAPETAKQRDQLLEAATWAAYVLNGALESLAMEYGAFDDDAAELTCLANLKTTIAAVT
jgi:hypothetical protein